jgi:hypothetical protein
MSLQQDDQAAAAVAKAPRVALADIEAAIAARYDFTAAEAVQGLAPTRPVAAPLKLLTITILVLKNGFTVIGKSAPASAENFDAETGKKFAYEDAMRQLWPLMGFALRDKLYYLGLP